MALCRFPVSDDYDVSRGLAVSLAIANNSNRKYPRDASDSSNRVVPVPLNASKRSLIDAGLLGEDPVRGTRHS